MADRVDSHIPQLEISQAFKHMGLHRCILAVSICTSELPSHLVGITSKLFYGPLTLSEKRDKLWEEKRNEAFGLPDAPNQEDPASPNIDTSAPAPVTPASGVINTSVWEIFKNIDRLIQIDARYQINDSLQLKAVSQPFLRRDHKTHLSAIWSPKRYQMLKSFRLHYHLTYSQGRVMVGATTSKDVDIKPAEGTGENINSGPAENIKKGYDQGKLDQSENSSSIDNYNKLSNNFVNQDLTNFEFRSLFELLGINLNPSEFYSILNRFVYEIRCI